MVRRLSQVVESHGGVDVIPQHGFASVHVSGQKGFHRLPQKFFAKRGVTLHSCPDRFPEVSGQRHFRALVGVEDRASVDPAPDGFQFFDDLHGPHLGRAAQGARGKAGGEGVERVQFFS
jgi:hypothetical protein